VCNNSLMEGLGADNIEGQECSPEAVNVCSREGTHEVAKRSTKRRSFFGRRDGVGRSEHVAMSSVKRREWEEGWLRLAIPKGIASTESHRFLVRRGNN